jgi:hypothetical protein
VTLTIAPLCTGWSVKEDDAYFGNDTTQTQARVGSRDVGARLRTTDVR